MKPPALPGVISLVVSPERKEMFLVDVKGQYTKGFWILKPKPTREKLYYVLAYVPTEEVNQFFLLTQEEANTLIQSEQKRLNHPDDYSMPGFNWTLARQYQSAWQILPK